jgi:hypothetical protein
MLRAKIINSAVVAAGTAVVPAIDDPVPPVAAVPDTDGPVPADVAVLATRIVYKILLYGYWINNISYNSRYLFS